MASEEKTINNTAEVQPLTPSQLRLLKIVVIVTGIFLFVGFISLASVIVYKLSDIGKSSQSQYTRVPQTAKLQIPQGVKVMSLALNNDRLALHIIGENVNEILIVDAVTGRVHNRILLGQGSVEDNISTGK